MITRRFRRVWQRNLRVYRQIWAISFMPPLLEPFLYLLAFGVGLGVLVGQIEYQGRQLSYALFITPALLSITIMQNAFFETTYASYVRMYYQKTFDAMMATPLTLEEIITAEIVWGATKSLIATAIMLGVVSLFGLITYPSGLLILVLAFLGGLAFGAVGMYFTGIVSHIELFNLPMFLFLTPMFLFSGTFFPLEHLPLWVQWLAWSLPLTHLVKLTRAAAYGDLTLPLMFSAAYLVLLFAVFFPLALRKMRTRLIK
jgi:lipooligosaccharide transport system permease protein